MHSASDPAALVAAAGRGDPVAWAEIVDRYGGVVIGTARKCRLADDEVDDVFQVVWIRLVENLGRLRDPDRLGGWLATTTRREAIRVMKKRRTSEALEDLHPSEDDTESDALLGVDLGDAVDALHGLDERCRRLVNLTVVREMSYQEVARSMDMPIGSVGPTRQRCLRRLLALIGESDD